MAHHPFILCWQAVRFYTLVANIQYNTEYCENNILYKTKLYAVYHIVYIR